MTKNLKTAIAAFILGTILMPAEIFACTNFLVSAGAGEDGSVMITYNADAGGFMEPFYYAEARDWDENDTYKIYDWDTGKFLGEIPQVPHTYKVVGNMNEHQVAIGETTFTGRKELRDTTGLLDYGSLIYLGLQRAATAREAIDVITGLVEKYGYYSTGESFSIADKNEVWIMEIIGKGPGNTGALWVARKVPDGYVCAHANQARIREVPTDDPENTIYNPEIFSFAKEKGWYKPDSADFSYADIYCPLDPGGLLYCEGRVWKLFSEAAPSQNFSTDYWRAYEGEEPYPLFIKPDKKLSVEKVIDMMRDHFEGTPWDMTKGLAAGPFGCPYRWKPLQWTDPDDSTATRGWGRPISTQQTAFAFVTQSRNHLPDEIGGVFWYGVDDNYSNVYVPLYCCMTRPPKPFAGGSIWEPDLESGFWVFNLVAQIAYTKYSYAIKDIQAVQQDLEGKFHAYQPAIETAAEQLYKTDKETAVEFLTDYSCNQSQMTVDVWRELWKAMVVKYNDGYVNIYGPGNETGRRPQSKGYGDYYLREVLKERPEMYKVEWKKKD